MLYAPTWQDGEQASSFFDYGQKVMENVPVGWNLIVKIHPLLEQKNPGAYYKIVSKKNKNTVIISEFPPVYPVLARCDAYLGDHSSVGYDFLKFKKPMFFFPSHIPARLHACGEYVKPENLGRMLNRLNEHEKEQQKLYEHAFYSSTTGAKINTVLRSLMCLTAGVTSIS